MKQQFLIIVVVWVSMHNVSDKTCQVISVSDKAEQENGRVFRSNVLESHKQLSIILRTTNHCVMTNSVHNDLVPVDSNSNVVKELESVVYRFVSEVLFQLCIVRHFCSFHEEWSE